jgi:hypothetical protein
MIKKNKVIWKANKEFDKLVAKYESEKSINFSIKFDKLLKKIVATDIK